MSAVILREVVTRALVLVASERRTAIIQVSTTGTLWCGNVGTRDAPYRPPLRHAYRHLYLAFVGLLRDLCKHEPTFTNMFALRSQHMYAEALQPLTVGRTGIDTHDTRRTPGSTRALKPRTIQNNLRPSGIGKTKVPSIL